MLALQILPIVQVPKSPLSKNFGLWVGVALAYVSPICLVDNSLRLVPEKQRQAAGCAEDPSDIVLDSCLSHECGPIDSWNYQVVFVFGLVGRKRGSQVEHVLAAPNSWLPVTLYREVAFDEFQVGFGVGQVYEVGNLLLDVENAPTDPVALLQQFFDEVAGDEARRASHQDWLFRDLPK